MRGTFILRVVLPVLLFPQLGSSRPSNGELVRPKRSLSSGSRTYNHNGALQEIKTVYLRPKRSTHTHIRPKLTDTDDAQISRQKRSEEKINKIIENQNERSRPKRSRISELHREKSLLMNTLRSDVKSRLLERSEAEIRQHKKRFLSNRASLKNLCERKGGSTDSLRLLCRNIGSRNVDSKGWGNPALPPMQLTD